MTAPANVSPPAERDPGTPTPQSSLTTRRALIKGGLTAGALVATMYAAPRLTSVGPKTAYAHTPLPNVDPDNECIPTVITFLHGQHAVAATHNAVIGTSYPLPTAPTAVNFVNWRFKDDPPGPTSLGFSDQHGAITDDSCGNPQTGVILLPSCPTCVELKLRFAVPANTLVTAKIIAYSAINPDDDCEPLEDDAIDGAEVPFDVEGEPRVESLSFSFTGIGPIKAVTVNTNTPIWGLDTVSFGTT
jgi:hypothetical protein